jgi:two-component system sensor histidine kinase RstB
MELLKGRLENIPPAQFESELDTLRSLFNCPLRLVDSSDKSLPPEEFVFGMGGGPPHNRPPRGGHIYIPLKKIGKVLIMGPMPDMPPPEAKFYIILVSIVLCIVGIAGFIMVAPVARNLRMLETAASHFGKGNLDSRAPVKSRDTVGSVARQFNLMAESIQKMIQRERQLLQSVSHELRTPIARIRFSLDMLTTAGTPEEKWQRIQEIDGEIGEIDRLVGELLDYNRLHSEPVSLNKQSFPLRPVLEEVIKRLQDFRPKVEIEIGFASDVHYQISADKSLFKRAIQNLIANAIRYANSRVVINYHREDNAAIIEICDDGLGIPHEKRELVLKPFYRVDQSGSKESGGVGLGLAIVSRIIGLHQGRLDIGEAENGGARFTTTWPD